MKGCKVRKYLLQKGSLFRCGGIKKKDSNSHLLFSVQGMLHSNFIYSSRQSGGIGDASLFMGNKTGSRNEVTCLWSHSYNDSDFCLCIPSFIAPVSDTKRYITVKNCNVQYS